MDKIGDGNGDGDGDGDNPDPTFDADFIEDVDQDEKAKKKNFKINYYQQSYQKIISNKILTIKTVLKIIIKRHEINFVQIIYLKEINQFNLNVNKTFVNIVAALNFVIILYFN